MPFIAASSKYLLYVTLLRAFPTFKLSLDHVVFARIVALGAAVDGRSRALRHRICQAALMSHRHGRKVRHCGVLVLAQ